MDIPWWKQRRHVILLLGILLAAEQMYSGIDSFTYYKRIEPLSLRGEIGLFHTMMRRGYRPDRSEEENRAKLQENFDELSETMELQYALFKQPHSDEIYEFGERTIAPSLEEALEKKDVSILLGEGPVVFKDDRLYGMIPGRELFIMGGKPFNPESIPPPPGARRGERRGPRPGPPPRRPEVELDQLRDGELSHRVPFQLVEIIPFKTLGLRSRARFRLGLGILGGLLMFLGSFSIWWLIGRKEKAEREAEEKRMLATLGKMSAVISHELRNPLAGAKGQIELLEMMLYEDKPLEKAHQAKHELERLEELSETLLSFVNSRRIAPDVYECSQLVNDLKSLARDKRLEVDTSQMPAEWRYDAITLVRAVDNLVSNALSFTPADGKVYLRLWKEDERLHISVRDEGPGFPADMDDMFEPFVTTRIKGTGLGMAIAAEVVRAHGGEITAQNHPDGGAFIQLWVPNV